MKLHFELKTIYKAESYTIGKLYANGEYICDTLEDKVREIDGVPLTAKQKIYGETAIPSGTYNITYEFWKKHNNYYPLLHDVPLFIGIFIHGGVTEGDTLGCILVGFNTIKGKVLNSGYAMEKIRNIITGDEWEGINITITR